MLRNIRKVKECVYPAVLYFLSRNRFRAVLLLMCVGRYTYAFFMCFFIILPLLESCSIETLTFIALIGMHYNLLNK